MDAINKVLEALHVDGTFFHQCVILVVLYFLIKTVLFSKLQYVLDLRESKTTKLENKANKMFSEAEELAKIYRTEMDKARSGGQSIISVRRNEVLEKTKTVIKDTEAELDLELEQARASNKEEVDSKRDSVLQGSTQLSDSLLKKLTE